MARRGFPWPWVILGAAAAVAAGVIAFLLSSDRGGDGEPGGGAPLPATVGIESGVRFELLAGGCGYEVVVTAATTVDPEVGEFCLVRLDVRNRSDTARSFDASCQYLIDASGARHTQREDVLPLDQATTEFFERELAPQTLARDIGLYYDVPKGTEAAELELHTDCDTDGVRVAIEA